MPLQEEEETPKRFLSQPCEDTVRRPSTASQEEISHEELKPVNTLNLDFSGPELLENGFLLFKLPSPWYFVVMA